MVIPALRVVGNIVSGTDKQTQAVIDADALPILKFLIFCEGTESIRREACWALSNITAGPEKQVRISFAL